VSGLRGRVGIAKVWTQFNKFSQQTEPAPHPLKVQGSLRGAAGAGQMGGWILPWRHTAQTPRAER